jgi:radial spoke head protein 9
MDLKWLNDLKSEFEGLGCAPTLTEIVAMKSSIAILCEKSNHDVVHFWGKVKGTERNYLIIVCYTGGLLGKRTAYASLDGVCWFGLPLVTEKLINDVCALRDPIRGQPLSKLPSRHPRKAEPWKDLQPLVPPKPRNEEEEEEEEKNDEQTDDEQEEEDMQEEEDLLPYIEAHVAEDQRLAVLVHLIDKNGIIFPQDALLWKSPKEVKINPLFVSAPEDAKLDDFCRLVKDVRGESQRAGGIIDIMPPLSEDLPSSGWKISNVTMAQQPTVKIISRLWPGLAFICKGNKWGTVYLGNGQRNTDFLFATN